MVAAGAMVVLVFLMSIYRLMLTPYIFPLQIAIILLAGLVNLLYFTESTRSPQVRICVRSHVLRIFIFPIHIKPITDIYLL